MRLILFLWAVLAPDSGTITGSIRAAESRAPIAFATVNVQRLGRRAVADSAGRYRLSGIPAGRWRVRAYSPGYAPTAQTVEVPDSGVVRQDFLLEPKPIPLRPLTASAARSAGAADRALFEREVNPGVTAMSHRELLDIPVLGEPDVLRALHALPGVTKLNDLSAQLHVWGGAPDQNLFLLDGARIFAPYHLFGMFGAVNADAVERIEFFRGALPARYGGALSSVVEVRQRDSLEDDVTIDGGISLLGSRLTMAGKIPWGDGQWLIAGRQTYADIIASRLFEADFPYAFHELQGRLTIVPKKKHRLEASFYESNDRYRLFSHSSGKDLHSTWQNTAGSLRWSWSDEGPWALAGTAWFSRYGGELIGGDRAVADPVRNDVDVAGLRFEAIRSGQSSGIRTGIDISGGSLALRGGEQPGSYIVGEHRGEYLLPTVYVEAEQWYRSLRFAPGIRLGYDVQSGRVLLEPRFSARYYLRDGLALTVNATRAHQLLFTVRDQRTPLPGAPLWFVRSDGTQISRVDGATLALEGWVTPEWNVSTTAYARKFRNLPRWRPVANRDLTGVAYDDGQAIGLEMSVRRHAGRFAGWIGYGVSRTWLTNEMTGQAYAAAWDRRHTLKATVLIRTWRTLAISGRMLYGSGLPFWPPVGRVILPRFHPLLDPQHTGIAPNLKTLPVWGEEQMRYPAYFRLDAGVRCHFQALGAEVKPYVNVLNLTGRPNVIYYKLASGRKLRPVTAVPLNVVPSVGLDVRF